MEFIGYAYNVNELLEILGTVPDYCTIVVSPTEPTGSTPGGSRRWYITI